MGAHLIFRSGLNYRYPNGLLNIQFKFNGNIRYLIHYHF